MIRLVVRCAAMVGVSALLARKRKRHESYGALLPFPVYERMG